jgi:predicted dehydrogenase
MGAEQVMNIGIVGCGLIGTKRAKSVGAHKVSWVTDVVAVREQQLAQSVAGAQIAKDWRDLLKKKDVDAVVIATTHDQLATIAGAALEAGKHVLVEKPGARDAAELKPVLALARRTGLVVRVGFNHRFHPSLLKCREILDSGVAGPLMFIRGRYGHGGRPGYEKEWRADAAISGGGEAIDQGIHLVDLSRWFLGGFKAVEGYAPTLFWDMPVEDNAFMLLKTAKGQAAWLHASWSEWKNMFSLEIYGRVGKLQVDGLGGSYGVERLTYYQMSAQMGPPATQTWEFPGADTSWASELQDFISATEGKKGIGATLEDAAAALEIVQQVRRRR